MKKEIIDYKVDSFIDFEGIERKFVVVAISSKHSDFKRMISIGVSICHKDDEFDEEKGVNIAINHAKKSNLRMFVTAAGMVSTKLVNTLIDQEIEYFKKNPASHISGYLQMQNENQKIDELKNIENNLNNNQNNLHNELRKLSKEDLNNLRQLINV